MEESKIIGLLGSAAFGIGVPLISQELTKAKEAELISAGVRPTGGFAPATAKATELCPATVTVQRGDKINIDITFKNTTTKRRTFGVGASFIDKNGDYWSCWSDHPMSGPNVDCSKEEIDTEETSGLGVDTHTISNVTIPDDFPTGYAKGAFAIWEKTSPCDLGKKLDQVGACSKTLKVVPKAKPELKIVNCYFDTVPTYNVVSPEVHLKNTGNDTGTYRVDFTTTEPDGTTHSDTVTKTVKPGKEAWIDVGDYSDFYNIKTGTWSMTAEVTLKETGETKECEASKHLSK